MFAAAAVVAFHAIPAAAQAVDIGPQNLADGDDLTVTGGQFIDAGGNAVTGAGNNAVAVESPIVAGGGEVTGAVSGVVINGASGTVDNSGMITGTATAGVNLRAGGMVTNNAGAMIHGGNIGVFGESTTDNVDVENAGTISTDAGSGGFGVSLQGGGTVANTGTVTGDQAGVRIVNGSAPTNSVTNSGTIEVPIAGFNTAIQFSATGGTVENQTGGTISGVSGITQVSGPGMVTIINDGMISGTTSNAIRAVAGASIENDVNGVISSVSATISITGGNGSIVNRGEISSSNIAVQMAGGGTVENENTISGGGGITLSGGTPAANGVTNALGATIEATLLQGVNLSGGGTVTNNGMISGATGVQVGGAGGTVTNTGTIADTGTIVTSGVILQGGGLVDNSGSITSGGLFGGGVQFGFGPNLTTVRNAATGEIISTTSDGIVGSGPFVIENDGLIRAEGGGFFTGIFATGGGTLINRGTIENTVSGTAVEFGGVLAQTLENSGILNGNVLTGGGDDTVNHDAAQGAINGTVDGGAGTDVFNLTAGAYDLTNTMNFDVVNVEDGATGTGAGTVDGTVAVADGGTLAPGNSIGTLVVDGPVAFDAGSFFDVEVADNGTSDLIDATGSATLYGGIVRAMALPGDYPPSFQYTILTADGGVTGTLEEVVSLSAFFGPELTYDGNNVYLTLTELADFASLANTFNQRSTATAVQDLDGGNPVFDAVLLLPDDAAARAAFDNLSGEVHATLLGVVFDSPWFREGMMNRLRRPGGPPIAPVDADGIFAAPGRTWWAVRPQGYGAAGRRHGDGNAADADIATGGLMIGADHTSGNVTLGFAGGFQHDAVTVADRDSGADIDTVNLGAYGGWTGDGGWRARGGAVAAWHGFDTMREVTVPGRESTPTADYAGWSGQLFGEGGWLFEIDGATVEPYGGLRFAHATRGAFSEVGGGGGYGGGAAYLTADAASLSGLFATLGVNVSATTALAEGVILSPNVTLAWDHAFSGITPSADLLFPGGTDSFHILGPTGGRDSIHIRAGADLALGTEVTGFVAYEGIFAQGVSDQALRAGALMRF